MSKRMRVSARTSTLAARLGHAPDAKLLIVNCDDLGVSRASNAAVWNAFHCGAATSASLMVPCPWAHQAVAGMQPRDVGVHLTLNAEYRSYRWGPITPAPSLVDDEGYLARTPDEVWDHANLDEVRTEVAAQIQRAIEWGIDVTHLDSHLGTLVLQPQFFEIYLDAAVYYGLPVRLSGPSTERFIGFPFRQLAASRGVVFPDHLLYVPGIGSGDFTGRCSSSTPSIMGGCGPGIARR